MTRAFLDDDFLLSNDIACELFHGYAEFEPILDYHCHLPPDQIAENRQFPNLFEIWLAGDHYKWRAMRSNGIPESLITGDAPAFDKFLAFAKTVPQTLRNPLFHWTHLELKRYFGITRLLNETSAPDIWHEANERLAAPDMSVHGLLARSRVVAVCTTDDPCDSLDSHVAARQLPHLATRVYPTFRPDKALTSHMPAVFNPWTDRLAQITGQPCDTLDSFLAALAQRHDHFHSLGGRLSDHGLERCPDAPCTRDQASALFSRARSGHALEPGEAEQLNSFLMVEFGRWDAAKGWTKQLHLGAQRNNNSRLFRQLGPDIGCDSIGDVEQARPLAHYLDRLDQTEELPKIVLYNLNPRDNYVFATMIGNFQGSLVPGKLQFGSGWWFLDQEEGMTWQLNALSQLGLLSRFVGMLTDSRSFLSYTRHEYFRRILCDLLGRDVAAGKLPADVPWLGAVVKNICFHNARSFFGLDLPDPLPGESP